MWSQHEISQSREWPLESSSIIGSGCDSTSLKMDSSYGKTYTNGARVSSGDRGGYGTVKTWKPVRLCEGPSLPLGAWDWLHIT